MNLVIDLLERRGFFIECKDDQYYLSENAASDDLIYMKEILLKYDLGYVTEQKVIIITSSDADGLFELFAPTKKGSIGVGACVQKHSWHMVVKRECASKIPLKWLEPNIARYIKALSACGIYTGGCCDGNHADYYKLTIEFDGPIYRELHEALWKYHLNKKFKLGWNHVYTEIDLSNGRESQYELLNEAAEYIYRNRYELRKLRKNAGAFINKKVLKVCSDEEIKDKFLNNVATILMKGDIQWI